MKKTNTIQMIYGVLFVALSAYMLFIRTELYESHTALLVEELDSSAPATGLGLALLGAGPSSQLQDSKVVEEYLHSTDMLIKLDKKFNLIHEFKSDQYDTIQRLRDNGSFEKALDFYNTMLNTHFDEISGILHIGYAHPNPQKSKEVLEFLVTEVEKQINELNRKNAKKQLEFAEGEYFKAKSKMDSSSSLLEGYQNKKGMLDPTAEATAVSGVITGLEATLTQKNIEYATKKSYLNEESFELQALKKEMKEIQNAIAAQKGDLSGSSDKRLNKSLFEFEKLKMQLEFDTEVYKNALVQLKTTQANVVKSAKTLSIISKPNMPDGYTYPNKPKVFITILIVMALLYGIFGMLAAIIRDHKE
jgi:capsular polysaccharide transport system permease protein